MKSTWIAFALLYLKVLIFLKSLVGLVRRVVIPVLITTTEHVWVSQESSLYSDFGTRLRVFPNED